jgi:hypothetical protein
MIFKGRLFGNAGHWFSPLAYVMFIEYAVVTHKNNPWISILMLKPYL